MPFSYRILTDLKLIVGRHWGRTGLREWLAISDQIGSDPDNSPETNALADFREIDGLDFDDETGAQLASLISGLVLRSGETKRFAFLVHSPAGAEFANMLTEAADRTQQLQFRVLTDQDAALCFLGLDPAQHTPRLEEVRIDLAS